MADVLDSSGVQRLAGWVGPREQAEVCYLVVSGITRAQLVVGRAIDTIMAWQHPDGGFGGGPKQAAHLLPTYAAVCSLAIVGRPGPGGGWDQIDRWIHT